MTDKALAVHQRLFSVEWGDMDALGHVNNGRYFDYFQQARIDWLESLNLSIQAPQGPVVIYVDCTFLKPIIYPATLLLTSCIHSPGRSSFMMKHEIYQEEQRTTIGNSKIVWVDYSKQKALPLPNRIRELFPE